MEAATVAAPDVREIVVFMLAGQRYALPIEAVQEIQQIVAMSAVPGVTPGLVGMLNLRGEIVPVVDARLLLGMETAEYTLETPMVIAHAGSSLVALLVDEVEDVVTPPPGCMQAPGEVYELADRLLGVCRLEEGFVFLLDPARLIQTAVRTEPAEPAPPKRKRSRKKAT